MKTIKYLLFFIFTHFSLLSFAQQYKLFSSDDRVYYRVEDKWMPVFHEETVLSSNSLIKTEAPFSLIDVRNPNNLIDCPSCEKGQKLSVLIKEGYTRKSVISTTSTKKGEDLNIADVLKQELYSHTKYNIHYALIGVHNFKDNHWKNLPSPRANLEKLSLSISSKMIPENNYNLYSKCLLVDTEETNTKTILDSIRSLSDRIKVNNNEMVFLYLSSHGVKDKNGNFQFITSDTNYDSINVAITNAISADTLNTYVNKMASKGAKVLVFIDACYSGTIVLNIKRMDGSCVYFMSTENDLIANDDMTKGSPFVRALIKSVSGEEQVYFRDDLNNTVTPQNLQDYLFTSVQKEYGKQRPDYKRINFDLDQRLWNITSSASIKLDSLIHQAKLGKTDAMVALGDIYYSGDNASLYEVEQDTAKALYYYRYAREWNNPLAACRLGVHYYYMNPEPNYNLAFDYFQESAQKGCNLGSYYLSTCYYKGRGVDKNKGKSKKALKKITSIDKDLYEAFAKERTPLSVYINHENHQLCILENGEVGELIHTSGYLTSGELIEINAASGKTRYQAAAGEMYLLGEHKRKVDYKEAYYWYSKAAEKGDGQGFYGLGLISFWGAGVEKDYKKAADYFNQAIQKKVYRALYFLGDIYFQGGYGIEKDERQAVL